MRLAVDAALTTINSFNILADTTGRADRTVVVGAHLDSVAEGAGINDNGTGSAAILETAIQLAESGDPENRVRFAFWGGEEDGLVGSDFYISQLSARELKEHAVNLNFDMVGSPNYVRFVYDGDGSAFGETGPNGSARGSRYSSITLHRRAWPRNRQSSTDARITSASSKTESRPEAFLPAPRESSQPKKRWFTAASPAHHMIPATTAPAIRSAMST